MLYNDERDLPALEEHARQLARIVFPTVAPSDVDLRALAERGAPRVSRPGGADSVQDPVVAEYGPGVQTAATAMAAVYAYSAIAHGRELLQGFLVLVRARRWPTTWPVCRSFMELAAHVIYVHEKLVGAAKANDYERALNLLNKTILGSRHLREQNEMTPDGTEWTLSVHTLDAMRTLDAVVAGAGEVPAAKAATFAYGELSEFSHPSIGTFSLYHDFVDVDGKPVIVTHAEPEELVPWPRVAMALGLFAYGTSAILKLIGQDGAIVATLDAIDAACRQTPPREPAG